MPDIIKSTSQGSISIGGKEYLLGPLLGQMEQETQPNKPITIDEKHYLLIWEKTSLKAIKYTTPLKMMKFLLLINKIILAFPSMMVITVKPQKEQQRYYKQTATREPKNMV